MLGTSQKLNRTRAMISVFHGNLVSEASTLRRFSVPHMRTYGVPRALPVMTGKIAKVLVTHRSPLADHDSACNLAIKARLIG